MPRLLIPWRLFYQALMNQPARMRQRWLRWWLFDDRGVFLVPLVLMPEGKVPRDIPLSPREKQERAVLSALTERKRAGILH